MSIHTTEQKLIQRTNPTGLGAQGRAKYRKEASEIKYSFPSTYVSINISKINAELTSQKVASSHGVTITISHVIICGFDASVVSL